MQSTTMTIRGLTADLIVEETKSVDANGVLIWYLAAIYIRERGKVAPIFLRKSRFPETVERLAAAVRRADDGGSIRRVGSI